MSPSIKTVLGFDIDSRFIGVAFVRDGLPVYTFTLKLKGQTFDDRLLQLVANVAELLPRGKTWPDLIAIEDRNVARNQRTTNRLGEMAGAVKVLLIEKGYVGPFMDVNAARKLAVIGLSTRLGREALKQLTLSRVAKMCQAQGVPPPATDHEADAVMVARAAYIDARRGRGA